MVFPCSKKHQLKKIATSVFMILIVAIFLFQMISPTASAAGLMEETIDTNYEYSKYSMDNYQLDFFVDTGWDWLPWKWKEGITKALDTGIYYVTNLIWNINLFFASASGYLVEEAFSLDFISAMTNNIGEAIQTLAGVSPNGFSSDGFYLKMLPFIILIIGIYIAYKGIIKKETSKAISVLINFIVTFVLSVAFIAYAPTYIGYLNDFSSDIASTALTVGSKISMAGSDTSTDNGAKLIRDNLFSIQVKQPWLHLQFGDTQIENIGEERVDAILSVHPEENNGETREEAVKMDIEDNENMNLSVNKVKDRIGDSFFILIVNIPISIFVISLSVLMIFSQFLFIIYAIFLPVSFLLSMIPSFEGTTKKAIIKLFNTVLTRAGIVLVVMVAFMLSTFVYRHTKDNSFFVIALLQILAFGVIFFSLSGIMSMFSLQGNEAQSTGGHILRHPKMWARRSMHRLGRTARTIGAGAIGGAIAGKAASKKQKSTITKKRENLAATQSENPNPNIEPAPKEEKSTIGTRAGKRVGQIMNVPSEIQSKASALKEQAKNIPVNARYGIHKARQKVSDTANDFSSATTETRLSRAAKRQQQVANRRKTVSERQAAMEQAKQQRWQNKAFVDTNRQPKSPSYEPNKSRNNNRPNGTGQIKPKETLKQSHKRYSQSNKSSSAAQINSLEKTQTGIDYETFKDEFAKKPNVKNVSNSKGRNINRETVTKKKSISDKTKKSHETTKTSKTHVSTKSKKNGDAK